MDNDTLKRATIFRDRLQMLRKKEEKNSYINRGTLTDPELAKIRKKRDLQVIELAKLAGVSRSTMQAWLSPNSEETRLPHTNNLQKLSEACGVSVNWLLGEEDVPNAQAKEEDWTVFEKYGISYETFSILKRLREQGEDLSNCLEGFNALFSNPNIYCTYENTELTKEKYYLSVMDSLKAYFNTQMKVHSFLIAVSKPKLAMLLRQRKILDEPGFGEKWLQNEWYPNNTMRVYLPAIEEGNLGRITNAIREIRKKQIKNEYLKHKGNGLYDSEKDTSGLEYDYAEAQTIRELYEYYFPEEL